MSEKLSWFPFDAHEFLTSRAVMAMKPQDAGCYVRLLCHQWVGGPLPRDVAAMGALIGLSAAAMRSTWGRIGNCFTDTDFGWINEPLEQTRIEQTAKHAKRARAGAIGARTRWQSDANANSNRIASGCDSDSIREDKKREDIEPPIGPPLQGDISAKPTRKAKQPVRPFPADWEPKASHREKALVQRLDLEAEAEKFRHYHLAKGTQFASWDAAFHTWLGKAVEFGRTKQVAGDAAGWAEVERQEREWEIQ